MPNYDSEEAYIQALEAGEEAFQQNHESADHSQVLLDHPDSASEHSEEQDHFEP